MNRFFHYLLRFLVLVLALIQPTFTRPAAQAAPLYLTADEVIAAVNALRESQGLKPYAVSGGLMNYAQQHSEYQARIDQWTHTHSDGGTSLSDGYQENIAAGNPGFLNAQNIVYQIWADPIHMKTMLGYASGAVGAGVASSKTTTYVTLNVSPGDEIAIPTLPGGTPGLGVAYTPIALVPLGTATPKSNGAVIHEVGYGQSLWAIAMAYKVSGDRIRSLNGMAPGQADIYAGQKLLIVPAGQFTPAPQSTNALPTVRAAALPTLLAPARGSATPVPALTSVPTDANIGAPIKVSSSIDPVLLALIGFAGLGLLLFVTSAVRYRSHH